jgi:hypothetical protein
MEAQLMTRAGNVEYDWVIARYTGEKADKVGALAHHGTGYFIRKEEGKSVTHSITVGFRRARLGMLPDHLELALPSQIDKLEELRDRRNG